MQIVKLSERYSVAAQITADDLAEIAARGFRSVMNNRPDHEDPGQPLSSEIAARAGELGLRYAHVPVVSGRMTQQDVVDFEAACAELETPVLLFCRSGARCAALWQHSSIDS